MRLLLQRMRRPRTKRFQRSRTKRSLKRTRRLQRKRLPRLRMRKSLKKTRLLLKRTKRAKSFRLSVL